MGYENSSRERRWEAARIRPPSPGPQYDDGPFPFAKIRNLVHVRHPAPYFAVLRHLHMLVLGTEHTPSPARDRDPRRPGEHWISATPRCSAVADNEGFEVFHTRSADPEDLEGNRLIHPESAVWIEGKAAKDRYPELARALPSSPETVNVGSEFIKHTNREGSGVGHVYESLRVPCKRPHLLEQVCRIAVQDSPDGQLDLSPHERLLGNPSWWVQKFLHALVNDPVHSVQRPHIQIPRVKPIILSPS